MAEHDNDLKPLDISKVKSATSRIDLSKATIPSSPATSGIRIGANPKKATSRIDVSAIPGAKAQTSRQGNSAHAVDSPQIGQHRAQRVHAVEIGVAIGGDDAHAGGCRIGDTTKQHE